MIIILLFCLLIYSISSTDEICEKFLIVNNDFTECINYKIDPSENITVCPNYGTWNCGSFICNGLFNAGYCNDGYYNLGLLTSCCTQNNILYIDFWFTPQEVQGGEEDWYVKIYDYDIYGKGSNITVEGQVFENLYNFIGQETFISITFDTKENCTTDFYLYINGSLAIFHNTNILNLYDEEVTNLKQNIARNIFILDEQENSQSITFISAHTVIPTEEQIKWLVSLGQNRATDVEICYNVTGENCTSVTSGVPSGYKVSTIVLSILLGVLFLIVFFLIIWLIYTYFKRSSLKYIEMGEL